MIQDTYAIDYMNNNPNLASNAFVIIVFDVTSKASFTYLEDYIEQFNHKNRNPNRLLYVVGNKCDKVDAR